jgi:hypothetical protein
MNCQYVDEDSTLLLTPNESILIDHRLVTLTSCHAHSPRFDAS